ncbi:hypothetical protein MHU86_2961 [Fragilaria crotonensis]|nr:hypothetical protein MHU86_2961 [Fragilaria crotonensis]
MHRSFGTLSTSPDNTGQQNELIQQPQSIGVDHENLDAQARSDVLFAWLDSAQDENDDSIYQAADRATETLFRWRHDALSSPSPISPPTIKEYNAILLTWAKIPHVRGVPQRAQRLLEIMEGNDEQVPSTDSYNHVLYTWAHCHEHMRGTMAQNLFQKLVDNSAGKKSAKPNGESYRIMMYAWAHSGEAKAAFRATGHLMKLLHLLEESGGSVDLQPQMEDYYLIFDAWTSARDKQAAEKSLNVLRLMENSYIDRFSELRADVRIFRSILQAYARSESSPNLGPDVDQLLTKIWDRNLVPDTDCFSFAIKTYANCALHKELKEDPEPLANRAHQLLQEMIRAVQKSETVQVSTENYNAVLTAFTASRGNASEQALMLLDSMEDETSMARPNAATYALVVNILAKSPTIKDRVTKSQQLIERAQQEYARGNETAKPDIFLFNAMIRACAASTGGTISQREATFRLALQTLSRDIRGNKLDPDPETFLCLLEASSSLLSSGAMQEKAMEQIFTICCQYGLMDRIMLKRFRELASPDLYSSLVVENSVFDNDGTRVIPQSWTANVTTTGLIVDRKRLPH